MRLFSFATRSHPVICIILFFVSVRKVDSRQTVNDRVAKLSVFCVGLFLFYIKSSECNPILWQSVSADHVSIMYRTVAKTGEDIIACIINIHVHHKYIQKSKAIMS